jgi:hypothetical protein
MMRATIIAVALTLIYTCARAQTFGGIVAAEGGRPLDGAVVQLVRPSGKMAGYSLTNAAGAFAITTRADADSLEIIVSFLGYKTYRANTNGARQFNISMEQESFALREVEIKPGRVWGRDTVTYDVERFISSKDVSIKDVIGKMPGIDVSETGKISYNGKDISNFYIEGMDLVGGRYNQITSNLDAKAVESVQVLDNHQPVRMLQDKIRSEAVALNLKLKAEFRDKWMATVQAAAGLPPVLWNASANAFQLSRGSQSAYTYKGNNAGQDATDEQLLFFQNSGGQIREPSASAFLSQPSIMASLKKERLLFNNMHAVSANRLYKPSETSRLRLNATYAHDERNQDRGSQTLYHSSDTTIAVDEEAHIHLRADRAEIGLDFENNADNNFLANRLKISAELNESLARYRNFSSTDQRIETPALAVRNELNTLWERNGNTLEARSLARYSANPSRLNINGSEREYLQMNWLYSDHSLAILKKSNILTQRYAAGIIAQASSTAGGYEPYLIPSWQASRGSWYATLSAPVRYVAIPSRKFNRVSVNPALNIRYRPHYAWQFGAAASAADQYGSPTSLRPGEYAADYRSLMRTPGATLPFDRLQRYSAYAEYRRAVREIFASLSLSRSSTRSNTIVEESFEDNMRVITLRNESRHSNGWNLQASFAKGFYDAGLKLSLNAAIASSESEQLNRGRRLPLRSSWIQLEPKLSWNPLRRLEAAWQANFRYGGASVGPAALTPLGNLVQQLRLSFELSGLEYNISGDHYYNDISDSQSVNFLLADCAVRYKPGRWEFTASLTNIFDTREYRYTQYSATQIYSSWMNIRGRELMIGARYRFF